VQCDEDREELHPDNKYAEGVDKWRLGGETEVDGELDMGHPATLRRFIELGRGRRPTAPTFLSIFGHGNGWSPELLPPQPTNYPPTGISWDQTIGTYLSTPDVGQALRGAGGGIDVFYFDACQMALLENAYEVRDSVRYLVASQATAWASLAYHEHFKDLRPDTSPRDLALAVLDGYVGSVPEYPFTISALDLSTLVTVTVALDDLADALLNALSSQRGAIHDAYLSSQKFDADVDYAIAITETQVDLKDFAMHLAAKAVLPTDLHVAARTVADKIGPVGGSLIIAERHQSGYPWVGRELWNLDGARGLSIYLPLGQDDWLRRFYNCEHLALACDTRWDDFVHAWYNNQSAPEQPERTFDMEHLPGPLYVPDDDVYGLSYELWTWPPTVRANQPFSVGLTVRRLGGKLTGGDVQVDFQAGNAGLGSAGVPPLWPNGSVEGMITASTITDHPSTLSAAIRSGSRITDTLSVNNVLTRTLTVLPAAGDTVPPRIVYLTTEQSIVTTPDLTLHLSAQDEPGGSGLRWVYLVEYVAATRRWVPAQTSGWRPFATTLSWRLASGGGAHYLQVWVADHAGNIGEEPAGLWVHYLPVSDRVGQGQARTYRFSLHAGQTLSATLTPVPPGDADLYLWTLDGSLAASRTAVGPDQIAYTAAVTELVQLEVYGAADADFGLQAELNSTTGGHRRTADGDKPRRRAPLMEPASHPPDRIAVPTVPVLGYRLYLPVVLQ